MKKVEGVYVVDSLENAGAYADYGAHFAKAVTFLQRQDLAHLPNGRYELDGEDAYAMIQEVSLKAWASGRPEVHHEFFDIQLPLSGEETIGVGTMTPSAVGEFDAEKDCGFYANVEMEPVTLRPGLFAIFHPYTCAHAPCCSADGGGTIRKIVIKVRGK